MLVVKKFGSNNKETTACFECKVLRTKFHLFLSIEKKTAAEIYYEAPKSGRTNREWFRRYSNFVVKNKEIPGAVTHHNNHTSSLPNTTDVLIQSSKRDDCNPKKKQQSEFTTPK